VNPRELAYVYVEWLPDEAQVPMPVGYAINPDLMEKIADGIQEFISEVVATLIDAGSEREAVMENEKLSAVILNELKGWGPE